MLSILGRISRVTGSYWAMKKLFCGLMTGLWSTGKDGWHRAWGMPLVESTVTWKGDALQQTDNENPAAGESRGAHIHVYILLF